jgi:hypothetical protein
VSVLTTCLSVAAIAGTLGWLAKRDHDLARAAREHLLDGCASLLDRAAVTIAGDGFPRLSGRQGATNVDVRLLSDTKTMRRLPQLWLQVTVMEPLPNVTDLAILVRPSGYEFYSLTAGLHHVIEVPPSFPAELIVRGEDAASERLFSKLQGALAAILTDPKVKEVAVTRRGLRIVRQAAEGRRGEHLLLRQAVFDDAAVQRETIADLLAAIATLRTAAAAPSVAHGAREAQVA